MEARASYLISVFSDDCDGEPDGHAADCLREEVGEEEEDDVVGQRPEEHLQEGQGLQHLHDDHGAVHLDIISMVSNTVLAY